MKRLIGVVSANDRKVKVMKTSHIPNDIFCSILSKLPIKSLKRFECVCKSWSLLFDNSYFMTMYRNYFLTKDHSYYDDTSILLHQVFSADHHFHDRKTELYYCVSGERFDNRVKLDWPNVKINPTDQYNGDYNDFNMIGGAHGTLCLLCPTLVNVILWNPSTKEFKVIPDSPNDDHLRFRRDHLRFGYDRVKDDYKVMHRLTKRNENNISHDSLIWEVYSLRSNSWKRLDLDMHNELMHPKVRINYMEELYIDGLSHCMCRSLCRSKTNKEEYLLSFDWSNDVFIKTPIPSDMNDDIFNGGIQSVWSRLVLLNGSIALILDYTKTSTFHISILGELGVKESWAKLFIIGPLPCLLEPIGAGKKGDMLFRKKDEGLVWFNLNTQIIEDVGVISRRFHCKIVLHKENLLPLKD